ncbi:MAG: carbohydrate ABC transporter permease, partial [Chloroflexota bacterium]
MATVSEFLTRTKGRNKKLDITDYLSYLYLTLGTIIMFGPVIWLVLSSFKSSGEVVKFPPRLLPYRQEMVEVEGFDEPLPVFSATLESGDVRELAQVRRIGLESQLVDPANPEEIIKVNIQDRVPVESVVFNLDNYREGIQSFQFSRYLWNSVVVTVLATALTLLVNSMAAFGLSKYKFAGRDTIFIVMISTLMVPISVILVPIFLVINQVGMYNSLIGLIIPGAATPTGVFLLRQYMLTIPDELLDSARIDGASEWRIYLQIILPLARPALVTLFLFAFIGEWNDLFKPLVFTTRPELRTVQLALSEFQEQFTSDWSLLMAAVVISTIPVVILFLLGQRQFIQ